MFVGRLVREKGLGRFARTLEALKGLGVPHDSPVVGAGPRVCIGQNFATTELKLLAATVLSRYDLLPVPGHRAVQVYRGAGAPEDGIRVPIQPRRP